MLKTLAAMLAVLALAACQNVPGSKEPAPSAASTQGPVATGDVGRVQRAQLRSSIALRPQAGAGSTAPARSGAYPSAIVNDLVIAAGDSRNLTVPERDQFDAIKPELSRLFGDSFRDALRQARYVDNVVGAGTAGAVVIEATLTQLTAATNRGTMAGIHPGVMDFTVNVSDAAGRLLGSYQLHYEVALRLGSAPSMEVQRRVFSDAGSRVAQAIAKGR